MAELRPAVLDDYGLVAALRGYGHEVARRSGLAVTVEEEEEIGRLPPEVETAVFRIVQEAVTNVVRHAGRRRCASRVKRTGEMPGGHRGQRQRIRRGRRGGAEGKLGAGHHAGTRAGHRLRCLYAFARRAGDHRRGGYSRPPVKPPGARVNRRRSS